ncbi:hypothetical protein ABG067_004902 [Albugo candida]
MDARMDPCTIIKMDITKEACLDMIDELQSARYIKDPEKQALLCWKIHVPSTEFNAVQD